MKARTFCEPSKKGVCMPREKRNSQSIGAMEEVSGKVHKASTHRGCVRVDVDALEVDVATFDANTSSLRAE